MRIRHWFLRLPAIMIIVAATLTSNAVHAAGFSKMLWVDSVGIDLSNKQNIRSLLKQPVDTIILPAFINGQTTFPTHSRLFKEQALYRAQGDVLERLISLLHTHHKRAVLSVECFHWVSSSASINTIFLRYPELQERDMEGGCGDAPDGAYASPFDATVCQQLIALVAEIGKRYPTLDGLMIECHLQSGSLLAYSDAARLAYIHATGFDPLDINFHYDTQSIKSATAWILWRINWVTDFVGDLTHTFRLIHPGAKVYALGDADWDFRTVGHKNTTLEDWPHWAQKGYVNSVMLDATWEGISDLQDFAMMPPVGGPAGNMVGLYMTIPFGGSHTPDPITALEALQGRGVNGIVAQVFSPSGLSRASVFWTDTLPLVESAIRRQ